MTYKDKSYGTDGFLRLSLSTSTSNFKDFNQPKLNLMISNNHSKTCQIDIQTIHDLIKSFDNAREAVKSNGSFQPAEIKKTIKRNVQLLFSIFLDENKREALSKIEIISNESDFTRTIMPLNTFGAFTDIFRHFKINYITIISNLLSQGATSQFLEVPNLIKGLPSGIVSKIPTQDIEIPVSEEVIKGSAETQKTAENFEAFVNMNLDSMEVPELKKAEDVHMTEIDSKFVKHIIENDLSKFEWVLNNESLTESPMSSFAARLSTVFGMDYKSLPGITDQEMKSLSYLSKLYFSLAHQNYVNSGVSLPHATPIFKYKAKEFTDDNLELAYDLLLIGLYIRGVRRRLEGKENDALKNCALFHLQLRCFIDPFVFSFIDGISSDKLNAIILQRYKYYKDLLVFSTYEKKLKDYNCPELTENDISSMITELSEKVINKTPYICDLHDRSVTQNSLRLPSENNFTLEQIINEIVPLEVAEKLGKDIKDDLVIEQLKKSYTITDEILNFFKQSKKKVKVKKESVVSKTNNLKRVVEYFLDDVPEKYKESFVKYITEMGNVKFNFITTFPLDEFGDNVIRALYVWDPEDDPQVTKNYKYLLKKIETEIMEKDQILANVKEEAVAVDDGWGEIL
jgi:hypothetical protein